MFFTEPSSKACTASGLPDGSPDRLDVERPRQSAAMSGADCQLEKQGTARRTWSRNFGVGAAQDGAGLPEIIAKSMWQHRHEQHCQSSCRATSATPQSATAAPSTAVRNATETRSMGIFAPSHADRHELWHSLPRQCCETQHSA